MATTLYANMVPADPVNVDEDWRGFAQELFGLIISSWRCDGKRILRGLPRPLDYDTMQDVLVEFPIEGQRHMVLSCLSSWASGRSTDEELLASIRSLRGSSPTVAKLFHEETVACEQRVASVAEMDELKLLFS